MRILIIEDEVTLNKMLAEGLKEYGYQSDVVETLKDGEYYLDIRNYDLVLMDWMLPDGNSVDIIGDINDFACMGGGCFPIPFNYTFMVPPQMPFPIFAFPTTLPSPIGPLPFIWPPLPIGMSSMIPGPIMSMLRIYLGISLTGGMGVALCWGPDQSQVVGIPPVMPIPYPPPIGNCIVQALPVDSIYP